jgi:hypothetical protein
MIGFNSTSVIRSLNNNSCSAITDLHNLQFTVTHALGLSVSSSRLLAVELNTETSASDQYEVFLLFRLQSLWNLGTKNSFGLVTAPERIQSQNQSHIASDGQSVSLGVERHLGLKTRYSLLFDSYRLVFVGRPL